MKKEVYNIDLFYTVFADRYFVHRNYKFGIVVINFFKGRNFSCVSAGGKFITHSIPEEYWYTDDSERRCFDIDLGDNSFWTVYESEMEWLEKYI